MALESIIVMSVVTLIFAFLFWATQEKEEDSKNDAEGFDWLISRGLRVLFLCLTLFSLLGVVFFGMNTVGGSQVVYSNYTYENLTTFENMTIDCSNSSNFTFFTGSLGFWSSEGFR